jgi:hypothetical protein
MFDVTGIAGVGPDRCQDGHGEDEAHADAQPGRAPACAR